jgi:arylsulfatase A-like enzyme
MRVFRWLVAAAFAAVWLPGSTAGAAQAQAAANDPARPNIVWIVVEDMSAHFSCYGETTIRTPNVDRLAAEGVKFDRAFVTGPICSISRSALLTGMYQTSIGAHHHRSGRGEIKIHLPQGVTPVPRLFKDAGYHTCNVTTAEFTRPPAGVKQNPGVSVAKTDYNFEWDESMYDKTHWSARKSGQPFFAQVQMNGGKLRGQGNSDRWPARAQRVLGSRTPASAVKLPPYLPDDPVIREDWAQYLDAVRHTDWEVGQVVERLKQAGELDNTVVFFLTDHGVSHVRNKQFLYDGGMHVPLVVRGPKFKTGTVRSDLVEHIDLAATSLALAGIPKPAAMQARDLLAGNYERRRYVFSARDRADETVERIRAVRSERHKYIRNFYPNRPYLQPNAYKDGKPIVQAMRRLHEEGKLTPEQALIIRETRPAEELYDLQNDPHELKNLAGDPTHQPVLKELRRELEEWIARTGDHGRNPEPVATYDSDMAVYLGRGNPAVQRNIELMKKWAAEGK